MRGLCAALLVVCLVAGMPALAVTPGEILPDGGLEARARTLSAQLRCLVCQNQSIDDSDAELARDLRKIVRERIVAGEPDEAILKYLVARYGDFILLQPPFRLETLLLWGTPVLALLLGLVALVRSGRGTAVRQSVIVPLSQGETDRLASLVDDK